MIDELSGESQGEDRLVLVGGESITGTLLEAPLEGRFLADNARPGQGVFRLAGRGADQPITIPAAKVRALVLARPASKERLGGPAAWLGCSDGSLVLASSLRFRDDQLEIALVGGGELRTSLAGREHPDKRFWDEITMIQPIGPTCAWLSDLKTLGYKNIPFLAVEWPYRLDRSVTGGRLRAAGAVFLKGLGMHTTSRLAYDVAGYRKLEAELALDETAGRQGSVIYKVLLQDAAGQWNSAYESPVIRGGQPPVPILVDLNRAGRMALIVEFADRGDELDHANWLNARLIK